MAFGIAKHLQECEGIGLTLVQGFAEAHGGDVTVGSSDLSGTIFSFAIPLDARKTSKLG